MLLKMYFEELRAPSANSRMLLSIFFDMGFQSGSLGVDWRIARFVRINQGQNRHGSTGSPIRLDKYMYSERQLRT